jgi:hypothetical protein
MIDWSYWISFTRIYGVNQAIHLIEVCLAALLIALFYVLPLIGKYLT